MPLLGDTNVIARSVLPDEPLYGEVRRAIFLLQARGERIYATPQVLVEFHALATRPSEANGLGLDDERARSLAADIEALFPLLPETPDVYRHWRNLINTYSVRGRQVYDARLVAVMLAHGVTDLLTLNPTHFRRFPQIRVVEPSQVR